MNGSKDSALFEIRRQLAQADALVCGARLAIREGNSHTALELLDMAGDVLSEEEYINRVHPQPREESSDA